MFGKLEECIGKDVVINYWMDGSLVTYEGILNTVVNYHYILIDHKNFLLFLAANGAIASITCDGELVYETSYAHKKYEPIEENIEEELAKRELDCFDDEYRNMRSRSTEEYFLKRGKELLTKSYYQKWEAFIKENIQEKYPIIKAVVDIVDEVYNGSSYFSALVDTFGQVFDYSLKEIDEVNEMIAEFFSNTVYEYLDFAVFMLHHAPFKTLDENNNMKQKMNMSNVYVSLAKIN